MTIRDQPTAAVTVDEFEAFLSRPENRDRRFELINGEIVEKMPTEEHGHVAAQFVIEFGLYLREHPIGRVFVEARYRPVADQKNDRLPDVSVKLSQAVTRKGAAPGMPDVAVEIQSPDDNPREMIETAYFYLDHGAKLVIVVLTPDRKVIRLTADRMTLLDEDDTLEGGEVLPGFKLPLRRIFLPPADSPDEVLE